MSSAGFRLLCGGIALILALFAGTAFAAQESQGILEIRIKDHRDAIGDFAELNLVIDKISISRARGLRIWETGWKDFAPSLAIVDLTKFLDKKTARVFRGPVDAGNFGAFHVQLKSIEGRLKKTQKAVPVKNTVAAIELAFEVPNQGETLIVLDLTVLDLSDHPPRGYELSVKGLELTTNGKRIQKIPPG